MTDEVNVEIVDDTPATEPESVDNTVVVNVSPEPEPEPEPVVTETELALALTTESRLTQLETALAVIAETVEQIALNQSQVEETAGETVEDQIDELVDDAIVADEPPRSSASHWLFSDHPIRDRKRD